MLGPLCPTYASEDLVNALKAQGLKVVRYRQGVNPRDADRAWNSVVDAKQQFRDEMFSISGDGGLTAATLGAVEEIAPEETENNFADGGMVTGMNRSPQAGPLARQVVPRETMAPMGYNTGVLFFSRVSSLYSPRLGKTFKLFLPRTPGQVWKAIWGTTIRRRCLSRYA